MSSAGATGSVSFAVHDTGIGIPAAAAGDHLRSVPAGRRQHASQVRRHRPRAVDLARSGATARRRHHRAERGRPGQRLHADAAGRLHAGGRRGDRRRPRAAGAAGSRCRRRSPAARRRQPPSRLRRIAPAGVRGRPRSACRQNSRRILIVEDDVALRAKCSATWRTSSASSAWSCTAPNDGLAAAPDVPSERDPARHQPARLLGPRRARSAQAQPRTRGTFRCTSSRSPTTRSRRSSAGAVGYAIKPVQREELVEAFQKLEAKLTQGVRRVLVVEDDERQRESIAQLLGSRRRADRRRSATGAGSARAAARPRPSTAW